MTIFHCTGFELRGSGASLQDAISSPRRNPDGMRSPSAVPPYYDNTIYRGPTGGNSLNFPSYTQTTWRLNIPEWTPFTSTSSLTVSFDIYFTAFGSTSALALFKVVANVSQPLYLYLTNSGGIYCAGGSSGTGATKTLSTGRWYKVQIKLGITSSTAGTAQLKVDGTNIDSSPVSITFPTAGEADPNFISIDSGIGGADFYIDNLVLDSVAGSTPTDLNDDGLVVALLLPISDYDIDDWTGGAGGTTNLYDAVNNTPPTGTDTETDLTQIECAVKNSQAVYGAKFNYTSDPAGTILARMLIGCHGEDINTGTKTGGILFYDSGVGTSYSKTLTFGDDMGALGPYSNTIDYWYWEKVVHPVPTNRLLASYIGVYKDDSTTRVGSCCFLGLYLAYVPPFAPPQQNTYHRAIAPLLVR